MKPTGSAQDKKNTSKHSSPKKNERLETEFPISEKDEVKEAEKRTMNATKKSW